jgi:DNA-binding NarL/FixJ family response regulator
MKTSHPAVLIAVEPTLYRAGLVALLHKQWPALPLTLTADVSQLTGLIQAQRFQLLILDGDLPGRSLPNLLHHLHQIRPSQQVLLLATDQQPQPTILPQLLVPRHITPYARIRLTALYIPFLLSLVPAN